MAMCSVLVRIRISYNLCLDIKELKSRQVRLSINPNAKKGPKSNLSHAMI
jgi:hypothetical protein